MPEEKNRGTLYGVGVGPGDPQLLTLKAERLIRQCPVIAYLKTKNQQAMAYAIASSVVDITTQKRQRHLEIAMPMERLRESANRAYDTAADKIGAELESGNDVVFLCEGDPFFFGSFAYIHERLAPHHLTEVVPGVTSISAAAAASGRPLSVLNESIAIISGRHSDQQILRALQQYDSVAILKPGKSRPRLLHLIERAGRGEDGCYIEYAGQDGQKITHDLHQVPATEGPYFALILLNRIRHTRSASENANQGNHTVPGPVIFSLTDKGDALGRKLQAGLHGARHLHRPSRFVERAQQYFRQGARCLFICSSGIVTRALAPVLSDKFTDPAVLVLDQEGRFVIPLLSGHEGGGSAFGREVAELIGAELVSTTSGDYSRPVYTIGIGSDRGCPAQTIESLYNDTIPELPFPVEFAAVASIDLKQDEAGIRTLAENLELPLHCYPAARLRTVEGQLSEKSEVVFREVGCYGVAEAAALVAASELSGNPAELVISKRKNSRSTIAVARSYR